MRTYLVTGGCGFIGSNYIHYMLNTYNDVYIINIDKLTYAGNLRNLDGIRDESRYKFIQADICDAESVRGIFEVYDIDRVVHFAAESHVDRSIVSSSQFIKTNVLGTQVLLDVAKSVWKTGERTYRENKKFLYVSTDEVYGALEEGEESFKETSPYNPHNPYSASKAAGDLLVKAYIDTYHFPANITHSSNNFGPRQHEEKLIPMVIKSIVDGAEIPIYGDGKNVRDWIYVEDHVRGLDMIQEYGKLYETYNLGGNNERSNIEIVESIVQTFRSIGCDDMAARVKITFVKDRLGHDKRYAVNVGKMDRDLGWRPRITFEEGMRKTVEWYVERR